MDVSRLPVSGGRVDFEATDFYDLAYGPGIEGGGGPMVRASNGVASGGAVALAVAKDDPHTDGT